jgi:HAE1 family hydrophobic/amphiphilic exporter-1
MEVREAVERVRPDLPTGIGHIRVEGDTDGPGAEVLNGRISASRDLSESWELLDRRIRQPLERIRGVARVLLYGVEPQQLRIDLDLAALKSHNVAVETLIQRVDDANLDLDVGSIQGDVLAFDVRSAGRFRDVETVRDLPLGVGDLRLRDVADVNLREPVLDYGRHLNRNFAIGFDVSKEPTANTIETVDGLLARIDEIRADPELAGIEVLVWENAAEDIRTSLYGLRNAGILGGLLALSVLYVFLRRVSTTLIVAVAIPFSLLVTCGAMFLLGKSLNVLTMLGLMLGIGMLVDNGVVVIENIYRLQGQGMNPTVAARLGTRQVALAVVAATATTIIVWAWLFVTEPNTMTIYIGEVASVICLAVACSLLISLTFIPLAAARFVPDREVTPGLFVRRFVPAYRALLSWTLHRPRNRVLTLLALLLLALSAGIPFTFLEKTDEPEMRQRDVLIHYEVHDASTKEVVEGYVNQVEDWIESRRDELRYDSIYSYYGRDWGAGTRVYLPRSASKQELESLREKLQDGLPVIAGVKLEIGDHRQRHHGPRRGSMIRVAVRGEDPEFLESLAGEVERRVKELPHLREVYGPSLSGSKEVRVRVDPERARSLGVSPQRVAAVVGVTFRGQHLRRFQGPHGEIEVILGLSEFAQPGLDALMQVPVQTSHGTTISLGSVAEIEVARTPPHLQRVDRRTTSWVTAEFDQEEITTEEGKELVGEALAGLVLPDGYSWDWGIEMRREDEGLLVMGFGVLMSLAVVVFLMAALFESITQPVAILVTLPLALFGAFWTLWIFGFKLDVLAFIGVIILIGLVVNNGIVMVDHVNSLRRGGVARETALVEGCGDRLRPVLMTAITTVCGLVPLAMSPLLRRVFLSWFGIELSQFTVAGVYIESMAVALMGGLISSTIFTLIALPVWYTTVEDGGAMLAGLFAGISRRGGAWAWPRGGVLAGEKRKGADPI